MIVYSGSTVHMYSTNHKSSCTIHPTMILSSDLYSFDLYSDLDEMCDVLSNGTYCTSVSKQPLLKHSYSTLASRVRRMGVISIFIFMQCFENYSAHVCQISASVIHHQSYGEARRRDTMAQVHVVVRTSKLVLGMGSGTRNQ